MERLPSEIRVKIFSSLPFNDKVSGRIVCRVLKDTLDLLLKDTTRIRILDGNNKLPGKKWTYNYEKFLSGPFEKVRMKGTIDKDGHRVVNPAFLVFLSKLCPNLQVLDAPFLALTGNDLISIAKNLRFFRCHQFLPVGELGSFYSNFEHLEGFHDQEKKEADVHRILIAENLFRQNKSIFILDYPTNDSPHHSKLHSMAEAGVDCLKVSGSREEFRPISKKVAQRLVSLHVDFVPSVLFSKSSFPHLEYLHVTSYNGDELKDNEIHRKLFFDSPRLKSFYFNGVISRPMLDDLFKHFLTLEHLRTINCSLDMGERDYEAEEEDDQEELITVQLPPNVQHFTFYIENLDFRLTNLVSSKLEFLELYQSTNLDFSFPNLKILLLTIDSKRCFNISLFMSLLKCSKLEQLKINFYLDISQVLQSLVDHLVSLKNLKKLKLKSGYKFHTDAPLVLEQKNFPSAKNYSFDLATWIEFHALDTFESLEMGYILKLKDETNDSFFKFIQLPRVNIEFDGNEVLKMAKVALKNIKGNESLFNNLLGKNLPKFRHLKVLEVDWGTRLILGQVESLLETVSTLIHLKSVQLTSENELTQELLTRNPLVIEQKKFPFVTHFTWNVSHELVFHPIDSFQLLEVGENVMFTKKSDEMFYKFFSRRMFNVVFTQQMNNLEKILIQDPSHLDYQLLGQEYLRGVEVVQVGT